jgi:hypothetical protein
MVTRGVKLEHYRNDGDAPDIPLSIYVSFLNQIRDLALAQKRKAGAAEICCLIRASEEKFIRHSSSFNPALLI